MSFSLYEVNVSSKKNFLGQVQGKKTLTFPYTLFRLYFTPTERHYRKNANESYTQHQNAYTKKYLKKDIIEIII